MLFLYIPNTARAYVYVRVLYVCVHAYACVCVRKYVRTHMRTCVRTLRACVRNTYMCIYI